MLEKKKIFYSDPQIFFITIFSFLNNVSFWDGDSFLKTQTFFSSKKTVEVFFILEQS